MSIILAILEALVFFVLGIVFTIGFIGGFLFGAYDSNPDKCRLVMDPEDLRKFRNNASKIIGYGLGHTCGSMMLSRNR